MSTATENTYEVLGVSPTASAAEIRRAWLDAIKRTHPDRAQDEAERVRLEELARELNAAYHELKDPVRRAAVDAGLRDQNLAAQSPATRPPTWATHPLSKPPTAEELDRRSNELRHQHHHRDDLFTRRGLTAFLVSDRMGQWLASATWLGLLSWVLTPAFRLDSATWLFLALVGLCVQAAFAHRFEHTPAHDVARLARAVAVGFGRLMIGMLRAASQE